jgi:hypothetical protein
MKEIHYELAIEMGYNRLSTMTTSWRLDCLSTLFDALDPNRRYKRRKAPLIEESCEI